MQQGALARLVRTNDGNYGSIQIDGRVDVSTEVIKSESREFHWPPAGWLGPSADSCSVIPRVLEALAGFSVDGVEHGVAEEPFDVGVADQ